MMSAPKGKLFSGLVTGLLALTAPCAAFAGGSFNMVITPQGETAQAIQQGFVIYSLIDQLNDKKKKNHAKVVQKGNRNAAAIDQKGAGNVGLLVQRGRDHRATLGQYGYNNALGVFQFGKRTDLDVAQVGNGQTGFIIQGGW